MTSAYSGTVAPLATTGLPAQRGVVNATSDTGPAPSSCLPRDRDRAGHVVVNSAMERVRPRRREDDGV